MSRNREPPRGRLEYGARICRANREEKLTGERVIKTATGVHGEPSSSSKDMD